MTDEPYTAPAGATASPSPRKEGLTGASMTLLILAWTLWILLLLGYGTDFMVAFMQDAPEVTIPPEKTFSGTLIWVSFLSVIIVFFLRWFVFQFLIHPKRLRPGGWKAAMVGFLGVLVTFAMTKAIEMYGLILFFGGAGMSWYLGFMLPSLILFLLLIPRLLLPRSKTHWVNET